jgi:hypothetical protein
MARTSTSRRRERDTDPMDSLKPLIVLGLLGTIMYGAYSVVQKGPTTPAGSVSEAPGAVFSPPEISLPRDPTAIGVASHHPLAGAEPLQAAAVPTGTAMTPPLPVFPAGSARAEIPPALSPPPMAIPPQAGAIEPLAVAAAASVLPLTAPPPPSAFPPSPGALVVPPPARGAPSAAFTSAWTDAHDMLAAGRYAEALAELMHKKARDFCGYGQTENLPMEDLIREKYRGVRPAPGYPACPDHTEKAALFDLLRAPSVGIDLTESFAMMPASSVSGFYLAHPQAQYFAVGKIGRDQVEDSAARKGMTVVDAERWLAPNLGYEPS